MNYKISKVLAVLRNQGVKEPIIPTLSREEALKTAERRRLELKAKLAADLGRGKRRKRDPSGNKAAPID